MTILTFGHCSLHVERRELTVDGELIDMQPLVFDLLTYFARHPGRTISKHELLAEVWRSQFVSASVVARAVMKARRAMLDDASRPSLLHTVARVGYRFDAQVKQALAPTTTTPRPGDEPLPLPAQFDLAVLPSGAHHAPADMASTSVDHACLLHHLLERSEHTTLLPMSSALAWKDRARAGDRMGTAPLALGVRAALHCEIQAAGQGSALKLTRWAVDTASGEVSTHAGSSLPQAMLDMVATLTGAKTRGSLAPGEVQGYAALAQALGAEVRGKHDLALEQLQAALPLLRPSAWLNLMHARLLHVCGQGESARAVIAEALSRPEAAQGTVLYLQLLLRQAWCAEALEQQDEVATLCSRGFALAQANPLAQHLQSDFLCLHAYAALRLNQGAQAIRLAEQAVLRAVSFGSTASQTEARIRLGIVLTQLQLFERASQVTQQAIDLARRCGVLAIEVLATRLQAQLLLAQRRYKACVDVARQGIQLALRCGDQIRLSSLRNCEMLALIESDRLDEAQALHDQLLESGFPDRGNREAFEGFTAVLDWKQGRSRQAVATLERLTQRGANGPTLSQRVYDLMLARQWVVLNELDRAWEVLQRMQDDPQPQRPMLVKADIAFSTGDRPRCIELLRQIWLSSPHRSEDVMDAAIDLAWILLEDERVGEDQDELESLIAHVLDYSSDYPPANILCAAYLLKRAPGDTSRAKWDAALGRALVLRRRYPFMSNLMFRDALAMGMAPRLPRLLTRMCQ